MAISMFRSGSGLSNYDVPVVAGQGRNYEYYETLYPGTGPQEWIAIPGPGAGPVSASVTISFPKGVASCDLQGTTSPPAMLLEDEAYQLVSSGIPASPTDISVKSPWNGPVVFDIATDITTTTNINICGPTAIRVNASGAGVHVSVRV